MTTIEWVAIGVLIVMAIIAIYSLVWDIRTLNKARRELKSAKEELLYAQDQLRKTNEELSRFDKWMKGEK